MQYICLVIGMVCCGALVRALAGRAVSLAQAYHNAPGIFWTGAVTLCIAGLLALWQRVQTASADRSSSVQAARRKMNDQIRGAKAYLGIPGQVQPVDILLFDYRREAQGLKILNTAHNTELWTTGIKTRSASPTSIRYTHLHCRNCSVSVLCSVGSR